MRALFIAAGVAGGVLFEVDYVGAADGKALLLALLAGGAAAVAVVKLRNANRFVGAVLHPNRQTDRDDRIFRTVMAARADW